jgi:hypothetical protein
VCSSDLVNRYLVLDEAARIGLTLSTNELALAAEGAKMMAKAPDERYKDCGELLAELERLTGRP